MDTPQIQCGRSGSRDLSAARGSLTPSLPVDASKQPCEIPRGSRLTLLSKGLEHEENQLVVIFGAAFAPNFEISKKYLGLRRTLQGPWTNEETFVGLDTYSSCCWS